MFPKVIDSSLVLDKLCECDAEKLFKTIDQNREFLRHRLPWLDYNQTVEDSANFVRECIKGYEEKSSLVLAIRCRDDIIGVISFHQFDWKNKSSGIGYWLAEAFQGRGIISKACKILIEHGFSEMGLNSITISCAVDNTRSRAIAEKFGFKKISVVKNKEWLDNHYVDHVVYSILAEEWKASVENRHSARAGQAKTHPKKILCLSTCRAK